MIACRSKMLLTAVKRALAGFVAGFILACFALTILGMLPPHADLSSSELEQRNREVLLALKIGAGAGILSVLAGGIRVSRYWVWFCAVFGIICFIPFWPHKSGVLPLGTVYVNWQFWAQYRLLCLGVHTIVSLCLAAIGYWAYSRRRRSHGQVTMP